MTPFAIAGVQFHTSAFHSNVDALLHRIDLVVARFPWVQMVLFSELAPFGPLTPTADSLPNKAEDSFRRAAEKHGLWLIPGSMFERAADGCIYNTASVLDPGGNVVRRYRKMFPFRPYESDVEPGTEFCHFDVPDVGRFGLSICYDMWFPETTRQLTAEGVEVLLHPVLTGTIDRDIEIAIARASAAQFQCYVFDINGLGAGGVGRSCVVDPTGAIIAQAGGQEEYLAVEVDFDRVRRQRETGIHGLGQLLKSFRDRPVDFSVYDRDSGADAYLHKLGKLTMPARGDRSSMAPAPASASAEGPGGDVIQLDLEALPTETASTG